MAPSPRPRRYAVEYAQAALVAVMIALFVRTFIVQPFKIPSPSMEDTLLVGDHVLVNKFALAPLAGGVERLLLPLAPVRRGDIVVFRPPHDPEQDYIKRVIGLPGETVKIVNRVVYVQAAGRDGYTPLIEPYSVHKDPDGVPELDNTEPVTVPARHYFVMGDNRDDSFDSREWGTIPRSSIRGRGLLVYWSFEGIDPVGARAAGRTPAGARRIWDGATAIFRGTRWERAGLLIR